MPICKWNIDPEAVNQDPTVEICTNPYGLNIKYKCHLPIGLSIFGLIGNLGLCIHLMFPYHIRHISNIVTTFFKSIFHKIYGDTRTGIVSNKSTQVFGGRTQRSGLTLMNHQKDSLDIILISTCTLNILAIIIFLFKFSLDCLAAKAPDLEYWEKFDDDTNISKVITRRIPINQIFVTPSTFGSYTGLKHNDMTYIENMVKIIVTPVPRSFYSVATSFPWNFFLAQIFLPLIQTLANSSLLMSCLYAAYILVEHVYPRLKPIYLIPRMTYMYVVACLLMALVIHIPSAFYFKVVTIRLVSLVGKRDSSHSITSPNSQKKTFIFHSILRRDATFRTKFFWIPYEIARDTIGIYLPLLFMLFSLLKCWICSRRDRRVVRQGTVTSTRIVEVDGLESRIPNVRFDRGSQLLVISIWIILFIIFILPINGLMMNWKMNNIRIGKQSLLVVYAQIGYILYLTLFIYIFFIFKICTKVINHL